jgi:hypothetical protein
MVTTLVLGTVLLAPAAPVPADSGSNPTGPAPRVVFLKGDVNGNIYISGYHNKKVTVTQNRAEIQANGQRVLKQEQVEQMQQVYFQRTLNDSTLKLSTADGATLATADAVARVKGGASVLLSADGKPVDKAWLRVVGSDTVVIASDALADAVIVPQHAGIQMGTAPRLVLLAADTEGKITIAYNPNHADTYSNPYGDEQVFMARGNVIVNGRVQVGFAPSAPGAQPGQTEFPGKLLDEVKFEAFDLKGNIVPRSDAMKRLKAGGFVLISGDGRLPDAEFLKPFQGDLLVIVSAELVLPPGATVKSTFAPVKARVAVPAAPLPVAVPLPAALPAAKPVQIAPGALVRPAGGVKVLPIQPVPIQEEKQAEAVPAPKPVEKPATSKKD